MTSPVWIICITRPDGQGWKFYADAATTADIERRFDTVSRIEGISAVAAFRNVVAWWEHKPAYYRNLQTDTRPIPAGAFEFINHLASDNF